VTDISYAAAIVIAALVVMAAILVAMFLRELSSQIARLSMENDRMIAVADRVTMAAESAKGSTDQVERLHRAIMDRVPTIEETLDAHGQAISELQARMDSVEHGRMKEVANG
jgi:uncharacterized protein HemX